MLNWQVLLDKLALDKEKHTLLQENQQLRAILKQYLDGKLPIVAFLQFIQSPRAVSPMLFMIIVIPYSGNFYYADWRFFEVCSNRFFAVRVDLSFHWKLVLVVSFSSSETSTKKGMKYFKLLLFVLTALSSFFCESETGKVLTFFVSFCL